ncbi:MAG: aldehyde dehydrogenase family protein [Chloroflexi bacterium]|nr:aldehyde dehydrogenase family protein [Chloroflexota bacterium]
MLSFLLNRPIVTSVLAAGILVGVAGVQVRPNANQTVPLPDGIVVFGAEHLVLEQGTNVLSGDTASNKTAVVQRESLLVGSLLADHANLGQNVRILENLEANRITGPNFTVGGETVSPRVTDDFAIPDLPAFTSGTENVRIKAGEAATLQSGSFNRIVIGQDARLTLQGGAYDHGYYVEPTIFDGVDNSSRLSQEEIFGPVVAVTTFNDEEEAIALANAVDFGLVAGIWSADYPRAMRVARRIRAGTIWIWDNYAQPVEGIWGGYKQSGIGRELGYHGLDDFLEVKQIFTDGTGLTQKPPYGQVIKD